MGTIRQAAGARIGWSGIKIVFVAAATYFGAGFARSGLVEAGEEMGLIEEDGKNWPILQHSRENVKDIGEFVSWVKEKTKDSVPPPEQESPLP